MAKGWTLRRKILIGYGLALGLMLVVLGWGVVSLLMLSRASEAILRENYKSILAAQNMVAAIERQDSASLLLILGYSEEAAKQFRAHETQFLQWLGRARDNITVPGEDKVVEGIERAYSAYLVTFSRLEILQQTEPDKTAAFYHESVVPGLSIVLEGCGRLRQINQDAMFAASEGARRLGVSATWSMSLIGFGAVGLGLWFSLLLSSFLVKPLLRVMEATRRISDGDYDVQVVTRSSDELGQLADGFNAMARRIKAFYDLNIQQILQEKRKSEAIIRSIDDGIIVVDDECRVVDINPTGARALGITREGSAGRHFLEVVNNEQLLAYVKQALQTGSPPIIGEGSDILTVGRGETQRHYLVSITPMSAESDRSLGVVLLLRDITKLRELDRMKSEFVMVASHQLRTPLTSVAMGVSLLQETAAQKLTDKERELLGVAGEELERIRALVNDLLDLSKIEAGKMELAFDRVPVRLLFERAIAALEVQAHEKEVELRSALPQGLPEVRADATKVTWILTNLIANALRYTERSGSVQLMAEKVGSQVHLSVTDTGKGIPYEYQSRIFDKFVQVNGDGSGGGTGLGLAICREMVRAHGGTIWVESAPGKGSTFTFTLPVWE
jgi:NtrC-family two-component system sensor histidine kinase KinB